MAPKPGLDQINHDLKAFLDFCRENQLSEEEIAKICEPLTLSIKKTKLIRYFRFLLMIIAVLILLYCLTYLDFFSWHFSAIGRIVLIELLPYWDWRPLKNEKCLVGNFLKPKELAPTRLDCVYCEAINKIYIEEEVQPSFLNDHYIELHKPVIVLNALDSWPIYKDPSLRFEDPDIVNSFPCRFQTNVAKETDTLRVLSKLEHFDEYFVHFQNCELEGMKAFRVVAPRLPVLPAEISPVQYSWLLASKNYNVTNYKAIELQEPITVVGQVIGSNYLKLIPRHNCEGECPIVEFDLQRGEALIFTSLWDLEYKPKPIGENIAVILEMH